MYRDSVLVLLTVAAFQGWPTAARAELKLPEMFTAKMVLQQEMPSAAWGWAAPGEELTVKRVAQSIGFQPPGARGKIWIPVDSRSATAEAEQDGKWRVDLPTASADGETYTMSVTTNRGESLALKNVVPGELRLCAGPSKMNRSTDAQGHPGAIPQQSAPTEQVRGGRAGGKYRDGQDLWLAGAGTRKVHAGSVIRGWRLDCDHVQVCGKRDNHAGRPAFRPVLHRSGTAGGERIYNLDQRYRWLAKYQQPTEAEIAGKDIALRRVPPSVKEPRVVLFAWNVIAIDNLMNKEGSPAVSFRIELDAEIARRLRL